MADLLAAARRRLAAAPLRPSPREAALLLGHVLGWGEARLIAASREPVAAEAAARFAALLARRASGEPVAYLTGSKEFYGRPFTVDRRVLVPRPETEHLVETALALPLPAAARVLDLGTGSGCLAVTLALERPMARLVAADLSPAALALAAANARRHGCADRVALLAADLATALDLAAFDLVVSNPPYVPAREAPDLSPEVRDFEPALALFGGDDGEAVLARLLAELSGLRPGTPLLVEIGQGQLPSLARRAVASAFRLEAHRPDYAGIPRVVLLRRR